MLPVADTLRAVAIEASIHRSAELTGPDGTGK
jgi:hypothetical protein